MLELQLQFSSYGISRENLYNSNSSVATGVNDDFDNGGKVSNMSVIINARLSSSIQILQFFYTFDNEASSFQLLLNQYFARIP